MQEQVPVYVCVCFDDSSCVGKRPCLLLKQAIDPRMPVVLAVFGVRVHRFVRSVQIVSNDAK